MIVVSVIHRRHGWAWPGTGRGAWDGRYFRVARWIVFVRRVSGPAG